MFATDFRLTKGDTTPFEKTLTEGGAAVDLTNASGVDFEMSHMISGSSTVDASASIVDAANGKVEYNWASGDTDIVGPYKAQWEVTWSDGTVQTFPPNGYDLIYIDE